MGIYLNPGNMGFWKSVRSEIYVDKTGLIEYTNKCINAEQNFICVSRPRRFGKSMALKMLAAYYSRGCDSKELFAGLKIESDETFGKHLNQYDVIYLNVQQFLIRAKKQGVIEYLDFFPRQTDVLATVLEKICVKDRHYTQALEGYAGEIMLIGINYDKDNKNKPHSCLIESVIKSRI